MFSGRLERALTTVRCEAHSPELDDGVILEQVISDLENLNQRTERDFLTIGGKLMEFLTAARQASADMAALGELISGGNGSHASQVLTRVLEQSRQAEARSETGNQVLAGVCESTGEIGRKLRGFRRTVSVFRVLGSLTRVETARLDHAGAEFASLAEDVHALTQRIESSGQGILDASTTLHVSMQAALDKITDLRASELKELPALIADVMASLETLRDRRQRANEVSLRQVDEYAKVSAAIEDLITALQFHDITRQQIEHVAEALRRIRSERQDATRKLDARAVLKLQSSQLSNAEQVFASSVDRIGRDLGSIAERVRGMADASQTLQGSSANEHESFFLQIEGRLTAILRIAGACAQAESETGATLAGLEETVTRMRESVGDVRQIETRIRRIAINAMIRVLEIGAAGNALNVIAETMQNLARDSSKITAEVAGALDAITGAANRLSGALGWAPDNERSATDTLLSEMRDAISEVHSSNENSFRRLHQITALSSRLMEEIHSARAGFSAGTVFAETIGRARRALAELGGRAGLAGEDIEEPAQHHVDDLAVHYTMDSEREVHATLINGSATSPTSPPVTSTVADGVDELGDNVELF
ncbi:MAG: hypothetical protein ABSB35_17830 [Bryobacteraceae bacterium]